MVRSRGWDVRGRLGQARVGPVAERQVAGPPAAAIGHRAVLVDLDLDRAELGPLVGAVAVRLVVRSATTTVPLGPSGLIKDVGLALDSMRFHRLAPLLGIHLRTPPDGGHSTSNNPASGEGCQGGGEPCFK